MAASRLMLFLLKQLSPFDPSLSITLPGNTAVCCSKASKGILNYFKLVFKVEKRIYYVVSFCVTIYPLFLFYFSSHSWTHVKKTWRFGKSFVEYNLNPPWASIIGKDASMRDSTHGCLTPYKEIAWLKAWRRNGHRVGVHFYITSFHIYLFLSFFLLLLSLSYIIGIFLWFFSLVRTNYAWVTGKIGRYLQFLSKEKNTSLLQIYSLKQK